MEKYHIHYKKEYLAKDMAAAITVAIIAIPQSMAYAIIAGVDPIYGLYTSVVASIICSLVGSSNHVISGSTNAICLLLAGCMQQFAIYEDPYGMLLMLTFCVGAVQLLMGILRLGRVVEYVSETVIIGFTSGAGVLILIGQLGQFLGISIENGISMNSLEKLTYVMTHLGETNLPSLLAGLSAILIILACRRINDNLPGSLLGIVIPGAVIGVMFLESSGISMCSAIEEALPSFGMIDFRFDALPSMTGSIIAIAVVGLIEVTSTGKMVAAESGERLNVNREFVGQGIANILGPFFSCFVASGSFTRTAVNYYSGAQTRIAGVLSGIIVALALLVFSPLAVYIPMPCLAGVIIVIACGMVKKDKLTDIWKESKQEGSVALVTMAATILAPSIEWALLLGIVYSIVSSKIMHICKKTEDSV